MILIFKQRISDQMLFSKNQLWKQDSQDCDPQSKNFTPSAVFRDQNLERRQPGLYSLIKEFLTNSCLQGTNSGNETVRIVILNQRISHQMLALKTKLWDEASKYVHSE
ncbi:hypothetical protein PoB_000524300 [Plakobranchus ocellatus]|uniref:Uncharacterized protein n=1 Tax=Plakobranchus ocellatus TaxID=259542 RepID=A0AAV3Y8A6_9GAST|nr:hypothetical protein PoB_000524300 [Plakobranchus ocellatus]